MGGRKGRGRREGRDGGEQEADGIEGGDREEGGEEGGEEGEGGERGRYRLYLPLGQIFRNVMIFNDLEKVSS